MTNCAEILQAKFLIKKNNIDLKNVQKNPDPDIRISQSKPWREIIFFKWILFNQKFGVKEKKSENCGSGKSGFQWFWRIFSSNFPPQQLICQMSAQSVVKMSGKI